MFQTMRRLKNDHANPGCRAKIMIISDLECEKIIKPDSGKTLGTEQPVLIRVFDFV